MIETLKGTFQCLSFEMSCVQNVRVQFLCFADYTDTAINTQMTHNFDFSIEKKTSEQARAHKRVYMLDCTHIFLIMTLL